MPGPIRIGPAFLQQGGSMKVRILVGMAGPNVLRLKGDVVELDEAEARPLIAAGYAEPLVGAGAPAGGPARSAQKERGVNPVAGRREKAVAE